MLGRERSLPAILKTERQKTNLPHPTERRCQVGWGFACKLTSRRVGNPTAGGPDCDETLTASAFLLTSIRQAASGKLEAASKNYGKRRSDRQFPIRCEPAQSAGPASF